MRTPVPRSDAQPFAAGTVTGTARAGKVVLKPVGSTGSGSARCAMKVPKGMSGKLVRGSIAVSGRGLDHRHAAVQRPRPLRPV